MLFVRWVCILCLYWILVFQSTTHLCTADDGDVKSESEPKQLLEKTLVPDLILKKDQGPKKDLSVDDIRHQKLQNPVTKKLNISVPTDQDHTFRRGAALASSIIVSVYEHGKFVGIVLIDRGRDPLGQALPGGLVRWGETCEECAKRTLVDECGLTTISNLQQFHVYSDPQRDPRLQVIDTGFTVRVDDCRLSAGTDAKRAWVCPIDKIPWDELVFDHRLILKDFIEYFITRPILFSENIFTSKSLSERNIDDYNKISKQAYRSPVLMTQVILEVYEKTQFKGVAFIPKGENTINIPTGKLEYGETIESAACRIVYKKCHIQNLKNIRQFKVYFDKENLKTPRNIFVQIARIDLDEKRANPWINIYSLNQVPKNLLPKIQACIFQDYLDYTRGKNQMLFIDSRFPNCK